MWNSTQMGISLELRDSITARLTFMGLWENCRVKISQSTYWYVLYSDLIHPGVWKLLHWYETVHTFKHVWMNLKQANNPGWITAKRQCEYLIWSHNLIHFLCVFCIVIEHRRWGQRSSLSPEPVCSALQVLLQTICSSTTMTCWLTVCLIKRWNGLQRRLQCCVQDGGCRYSNHNWTPNHYCWKSDYIRLKQQQTSHNRCGISLVFDFCIAFPM